MERGEIKDRQAFYKLITSQISTEIGGTIMSLSEQLRYEGQQEGLRTGLQTGIQTGRYEAMLEVAERLLAEGAELTTIARVTGLSPETIIERFMSTDA